MPAVAPFEKCGLTYTPEEVARVLSQEEGFVFLDSSDASGTPEDRLSLITARPTRILKGDIRQAAALRESLERNAHATVDWGYPTGGLIGHVDYEGRYLFGEYPHLLIYRHRDHQWFAAGNPPFLNEIDVRRATPRRAFAPIHFHQKVSRERFIQKVKRAQEYIAAGDIYQVNLAHAFQASRNLKTNPFDVYECLRERSPAPYAAFLHLGGKQVLSSSPECFLQLSGRGVTTRPIKGTRPRLNDPYLDEKSAYDLITSAKEIAELVMITDLERNDLGQFCEYGSVHVSKLLELERFAQVFHLVSTVEGRLRDGTDHVEALRLCFPGGSITGAPKKRAREIINELEQTPRGLYTGAIGYLGWNEESQFNIAIRTLIAENDSWHFHVGAGIVADSKPGDEYDETLHKAAGILQACRPH